MGGLNIPNLAATFGTEASLDPYAEFARASKETAAVQAQLRANKLRTELTPIMSDPNISLADKVKRGALTLGKHDATAAFELALNQQKDEVKLQTERNNKDIDNLLKIMMPALESGSSEAVNWANSALVTTLQSNPNLSPILTEAIKTKKIPSLFKTTGGDYVIEQDAQNGFFRLNKLTAQGEPVLNPETGKQIIGQPKGSTNINLNMEKIDPISQAQISTLGANSIVVRPTEPQPKDVKPTATITNAGKEVVGYGYKVLPADKEQVFTDRLTLLKSLDAIEEKVHSGQVKTDVLYDLPFGLGDAYRKLSVDGDQAAFNTSVQLLQNKYRKDITGAAASFTELLMLRDTLMSSGDRNPEIFIKKLQAFKRSVLDQDLTEAGANQRASIHQPNKENYANTLVDYSGKPQDLVEAVRTGKVFPGDPIQYGGKLMYLSGKETAYKSLASVQESVKKGSLKQGDVFWYKDADGAVNIDFVTKQKGK